LSDEDTENPVDREGNGSEIPQDEQGRDRPGHPWRRAGIVVEMALAAFGSCQTIVYCAFAVALVK
jgi:hypothetical protein